MQNILKHKLHPKHWQNYMENNWDMIKQFTLILTLLCMVNTAWVFFSPLFLNGRVCYTEKKRALFDLQISATIICFPLIFSRVPWNLNYLSPSSWNTLFVIICTLKNRQQDLYSPCLRTIATKREENIRKQWLDFITKGSFVFTYELIP